MPSGSSAYPARIAWARAGQVPCRSAGDGRDMPSEVIELMNLSPASMNEAAASWTPLPLGGDADAGGTPAGSDITAPSNFAGCA
jgi:hypothetical protein